MSLIENLDCGTQQKLDLEGHLCLKFPTKIVTLLCSVLVPGAHPVTETIFLNPCEVRLIFNSKTCAKHDHENLRFS